MDRAAKSTRKTGFRLACLLVASLSFGGCVSHQTEPRRNHDLQQLIYDSVPLEWREAADSAEFPEPLAVAPDLHEFLLASIPSNAADRDRILALARKILVKDGIGLTYNPDATYTASEAFRSGEGNCLGFANLLVASARELGLNAGFELVSQPLRWTRVDDVLVVSLHVRVTSLSSGRRMVFDFYPLPLEPGYSTTALSDAEAFAHHLNNLAADAMQRDESGKAFALLHGAIQSSPDTAFIWSNLGILLARHGFEQLAENSFEEALAISPDTFSALSNLQSLYVEQGRLDEAQELQQRLAAYRMRNPYYHFALGEKAYDQGRYQVAVEHIRDAIERKNNDRSFYLLLADTYRKLGKDNAAASAIRKANSIKESRVSSDLLNEPDLKLGTRISSR